MVTHVFGRVLDAEGSAVPHARIEIWQCDSHGRYHYVDDRSSPPVDADFQGYGSTISGTDGAYRFRTIRPVPYPGRTPHIHFAISAPGRGRLITQMYVAGEPLNERDSVLAQISDPGARARVIVPLEPAPQMEAGALAGSGPHAPAIGERGNPPGTLLVRSGRRVSCVAYSFGVYARPAIANVALGRATMLSCLRVTILVASG